MTAPNNRPPGSRCWSHDLREPCGHPICDDCAVACGCEVQR